MLVYGTIFQNVEILGNIWETNEVRIKLIKIHLTGIAPLCIMIMNVEIGTFNC